MTAFRHLLTINTTDHEGAGTDENVKIFFSAGGIVLGGTCTIPSTGAYLEKGHEDQFYLELPVSLHAADTVSIRLESSMMTAVTSLPSWHCGSLSIEREGWKKTFHINDWFRPDQSYKTYTLKDVPDHVLQFDAVAEGTKVSDLIGRG